MTDEIREYILEHGYELPAEDDVEAMLDILYEIHAKLSEG